MACGCQKIPTIFKCLNCSTLLTLRHRKDKSPLDIIIRSRRKCKQCGCTEFTIVES